MLKNLGQTLNITHPLKEQMMTQKKKSLGEVEGRGSNEWIKKKGEKEGKKGYNWWGGETREGYEETNNEGNISLPLGLW